MDRENELDATKDVLKTDFNTSLEDTKEKETLTEYNTNKGNIVGDDYVFYSPGSVDELNTAIQKIYKDFYSWLKDIETVDALFDSVISPYIKGSPPHDKRFIVLIKKYVQQLDDAKKIFDDTLTEIIDYIDDYSRNKTLTVNATSMITPNTNKTSDFTSDGDINKTIDNYDMDRINYGNQDAHDLNDDNLELDSDTVSPIATSSANNVNVNQDIDTLEINNNTIERLNDDSEDEETSEVRE